VALAHSSVLGIDDVHPSADAMSSINVHFAAEGMEFGWHFDDSSFAVGPGDLVMSESGLATFYGRIT
jgi:hypothetical protein